MDPFIAILIVLSLSLVTNVVLLLKQHWDKPVDGLLNIDMRDPEKDYYDFVFLTPTDEIPKKKYMLIEVHTKSGISPGENLMKTFDI